jgi:hypothetical protein
MKRRQVGGIMLLATAMGALACANGTLPRRSPQHPGHPSAPEGYVAAPLAALASESERDPAVRGREAESTVYVCPMHPEVVSGTPGNCPKCGMKLVPKPTPPKHEHSATP